MHVAGSPQTPALGSAISAAVAAGAGAGGYDRFEDAQRQMTSLGPHAYVPSPESKAIYGELYAMYRELHDTFGGVTANAGQLQTLMKRLLGLRERVVSAPARTDREMAGT
jgi:L-ribulokinase